jgi:hypothetical protein
MMESISKLFEVIRDRFILDLTWGNLQEELGGGGISSPATPSHGRR